MENGFYIVNIEAAIYKHSKWLLIERSRMEEHAAGTLAMVGGKVDNVASGNHILEETLRREIAEEVGISIHNNPLYLKSSAFVTDNGKPVINIVFLCQYKEGEPTAIDPKEVSSVVWLNYEEVKENMDIQPWTKDSLRAAEQVRLTRYGINT
jgi:ADP-ribose pyrophosphatase YjhB (NUDIX family)